jgi:diguanylate cyclase (GGDEF)-like protein
MSRTLKSSRIIIINSILMLCLIAILIAQNIYFLNKNNTVLSNIDENYNRKLDVVMLMSKVVRERSLNMVTMFLSDDAWERDKVFINFHKLKLVFLSLNAELRELGLIDNERVLYEKIMSLLDKTELIQIDIVERIQSGGDKTVHSDISKNDLPLESEVLGAFDSLTEVMRNNADVAREQAKKQYREIINLVVFIAVLVFVVVIFLMRRSLLLMERIESGLINEAESLSWDATHDALTNVYNRRWLQHKFKLIKSDKNEEFIKHSLLYIDLDEFKPVNDIYGHVAGDNFLCQITRELEQCIRQNDTLARLGGDEFAILLENCDVEKATSIAECLILRVNKFFLNIEGNKVVIAGCSIGINEFLGRNSVFDEKVKQADSACYAAKKNGKNQVHIFAG